MRQFPSDLPYTKPESVNFLPGEVERCVDLHENCNIRQLDKATVVAAASQDWSADALKKNYGPQLHVLKVDSVIGEVVIWHWSI